MATIVTSTQTPAFKYPSASYMDRSPVTGNLAVVVRLTSGELRVYSSVNNGTSWVDTTAGFNRSNIQEWSSLFIDTDGFVHIAYRVYESGNEKIYYRRAGLNDSGVLVWDSEVLISFVATGSAGNVYQGVDVIAVKIGDAYYVHFAVGTTSGSNVGVTMFSLKITYEYSWFFFPYWAYTVKNSLITGTRSWFVVGSGRVTPALDFRHNGDAHTSDVPDLWVAFGRAQTCIARMSYASGKWTGSTSIALATPTTAMDANPGRFDGSRFLVPSLNGAKVDVYERDLANTTTTLRQSPTHTTGVVRYVAIDYVPSTGDFRVFAVGTSTAVLYYVDYVRATNSWGAWVSTALTLSDVTSFGTRRSAYGNARYDYYTQTGSSPYTYSSTHTVLPFPPNTPVWLTPTTGSAQDVGVPLTLTWQFSDPNTSDTQSAYALSRQIGAGTIQYWTAGTATWGAVEVQNSSATSNVTLPTAWGLDADATHVYKVKVWDSTSLPSGYSAGLSITPSVPIVPSITSPSLTVTNIITDTFTRVAANLAGTAPDVGPVGNTWSATANCFSVDGSKLVSIADANTLGANLDAIASLNTNTTAYNAKTVLQDIYLSTLSSTVANRFVRIRARSGSGGYVGVYINVNSSGAPTLQFIKVISGVTTSNWGGSNSVAGVIPSNTALNGPYTLTLTAINNVVTATISSSTASLTFSRYLTNAEVTTLSSGNTTAVIHTFTQPGTPQLETNISGFTYDSLTIATFTGPFITAQWTATGQVAYRITLSDVSGGASVQTYDSGWVNSAEQSVAIPFRLTDLTTYSMTLQIRNAEGLVGPSIERTFYVDYTEPPTPTYVVSPNGQLGYMLLSTTNPKATGTQPELVQNDVYRRTVGETSIGSRIASIAPSYLPMNILKLDGVDRESMESTTLGWFSSNAAVMSVARSNVMALDGLWSLEHTVITSIVSSKQSFSMPVLASTQYTVSYWVRSAVTPRSWTVFLDYQKGVLGSTTPNGTETGSGAITSSTSAWTRYTYTFTTPALTTYLNLGIGYPGSASSPPAGEKHYFDRIELIQVGDLAAPVLYNDITARHGVNYEYRIQAIGTNGAAQYGAWVS